MRRTNEWLYWALAGGVLLGAAWIWWHAGKGAPKTPHRAQKQAVSRQSTAPKERGGDSLSPHFSQRAVTPRLATNYSRLPDSRVSQNAASRAGLSNSIPGLVVAPDKYPRPALDILELQVALARQGISCGSLDGRIGSQTRAALRAFQLKEHLPITGEWTPSMRERLTLSAPALAEYTFTTNDLARLQPLGATWLAKSQQTALEFETPLELVCEMRQAHPNLVRRLNPSLDWSRITAGTTILVPDVCASTQRVKAAFITIRLSDKTLDAFDSDTNLLAHFPCSIARSVEKRPAGELHVVAIAPNPNYTFDPDIFPESPEARELKRKLILQPGPNNPVGVAWIGLDKPGYGIHGTPLPEQVGRTESHGCFRLANWNAERLLQLVWMGLPVNIEP